jgi:type II restriction/modification system DNA methylase subunit YeeA
LNAPEFIAKWKKAELKERSAAQEHFIDLCRLVGHQTPAEADPTGETFCFEKGAEKHGGGDGFADVWKKDFFGWEYKGKHKDLSVAYDQLLLYRDALANPPLLVVCDLDRIIVHTNFTKTVSVKHEIPLDQLGEPRSLEILRAVFFDPEKLLPGKTSEAITQEAAQQFAGIAESMRKRGLDSAHVAHFLDRVVFCLFAEDIGLLPDQIFTRITEKSASDPVKFAHLISQLFAAMTKGGEFGLETIRHFNGNLFDDAAVPELTAEEIKRIAETARLDWSAVDPSIFGTLFERGLDPAKRSQLGAHFTGKEDIELLVEAVAMTPLRREWTETQQIIETVLTTGKKKPGVTPASPEQSRRAKPMNPAAQRKARGESESIIHQFLVRLQGVKVLDPACGSGNFLYVTLQKLKDLEKQCILYSMEKGLGSFLPMVGPWQLHGIEINPYAYDLAQMTVWIGWLQWIKFNGFGSPQDPILRQMSGNFQCKDSIIDLSDPANPKEPEWPKVDFIVGNPPFLGGSKLWQELGRDYQAKLWQLYKDRVPGAADLCCYWFEKARAHIATGKCKRAGLLATQGIRGGANREVLKRIKERGDIFWAESDRPWILDGANVHVSMAAFDDGTETTRILDGKSVKTINANLTAHSDTTEAKPLQANYRVSFQGSQKIGAFDIQPETAFEWLAVPNAHGRPNSDVLRPSWNGIDLTRRQRNGWMIDFGTEMSVDEAAYFEKPFQFVLEVVKPERDKNNREAYRKYWWRHGEPRIAMRAALLSLERYFATPEVAKHTVFSWVNSEVLPDKQLIVIARSDDYSFGVLHSRFHSTWSLKQGTRLENRPRYTPTTCFETFPFPDARGETETAIAAAAKELNELRENWLNPPEWTRTEILEFSGTVGGPWNRYIDPATVIDRGELKVGTVRYPRLVPRDAECATNLKERTLTKLYNERPAWLAACHAKLDAAVATAYGWSPDISDDQILERLLELNLKQTPTTSSRG